MSQRNAELLLILALGLRGSSLLFSKIALSTMGPFTLMGIRFLLSFLIIALIFHRKMRGIKRSTILMSMAIGGGYFLTMSFELFGLKTTPSSTTAFLENTAVVIIPIVSASLQHKLPTKNSMISAFIGLAGVAFLTLKGSHFNFSRGEFLVLMSAFLYTFTVIVTNKSAENEDTFHLGVLQLFFIGLFGIVAAFIFEDPTMPRTFVEWRSILYLAIVCSAIGFTLQPVAQKYTTVERTGLFTAFNPLVAGVLGVVFLNESFGITGFIGAVLLLFSIFYSSASESGIFNKKLREKE